LSRGSDGWTYTDLFNFNPTVGYAPPAPPIWDGKGKLYGTTEDGGLSQPACWTSSGCGLVFKMTPNGDSTWTYHILHRFASFPNDGESPDGGLVMDASGNHRRGGANGQGRIFMLTLASDGRWKEHALYDFPNCAEGCFPNGTMVFDRQGNLYGASGGGVADCGGYFSVSAETVVIPNSLQNSNGRSGGEMRPVLCPSCAQVQQRGCSPHHH
jgi:hypothetical protein